MVRWESTVQSHRGCVRRVNEDAVLDRPDIGLWAVADGMGGYETGAVASRMVVDALGGVPAGGRLSGLVDAVEDVLMDVNTRILAHAEQHLDGRMIGTTVVTLILRDRAGACVWAGDSRLYRLRDGRFEQISRDHSHVQELIDEGELLPEDAEGHAEANVITRAVGALPALFAEATVFSVREGDVFLLCSDGLYKEMVAQEMVDQLANRSAATAAHDLLDQALARGARDNVSVVVVDCRD